MACQMRLTISRRSSTLPLDVTLPVTASLNDKPAPRQVIERVAFLRDRAARRAPTRGHAPCHHNPNDMLRPYLRASCAAVILLALTVAPGHAQAPDAPPPAPVTSPETDLTVINLP